MPRKTATASAAAALAALSGAAGHGQMTTPAVRPDADGFAESFVQRRPTHTLSGPMFGYGAGAYRCRELPPASGAPETTLVAGQAFDVAWKMEAGHPRDCYLYVSYDLDVDDPVNWFKIAAFPGCGGAANGQAIPDISTSAVLPAELPACDHCVLRWEWTAHQQVSNIEFYVTCADIAISSSAPSVRPSPMVAISGVEHLPSSAEAYRQAYQGQDPEENYLVGPAVATYTPCVPWGPGSAGCIRGNGDSISAAPTKGANPLVAVGALTLLTGRRQGRR